MYICMYEYVQFERAYIDYNDYNEMNTNGKSVQFA